MNAKRRSAISKIQKRLEVIKGDIEIIKADEQSAFDNMPESMQQADRGTKCEEAVIAMENAIDDIDNAINSGLTEAAL